MICTAQRTHRAIRRKLLISCATFAIATAALTPQKVRAQAAPTGAFQGTITSSSGASQTSMGTGTETITGDVANRDDQLVADRRSKQFWQYRVPPQRQRRDLPGDDGRG